MRHSYLILKIICYAYYLSCDSLKTKPSTLYVLLYMQYLPGDVLMKSFSSHHFSILCFIFGHFSLFYVPDCCNIPVDQVKLLN